MKGFILPLRPTSMRTICSCLSLLGRCLGKLFMRYIIAFSGNAPSCCCLLLAPGVWGNIQCIFIHRALLSTSLLRLSSWVKSWVTTTPLCTASSMSCLRWTLSFTRTSLQSRSAPTAFRRFCFLIIFTIPPYMILSIFFSALWWWCRGFRTDIVLWWGCYGTSMNGRYRKHIKSELNTLKS